MRTYSPFTTRHLLNEFNSLFEQGYRTQQTQQTQQLFSTDTGWALRIDLPGFNREEIALDFEDKALLLHASQEDSAEGATRPSVQHRFALGEEVDTSAITAALEHGVLEITLPRKEDQAEQSKRINIQ